MRHTTNDEKPNLRQVTMSEEGEPQVAVDGFQQVLEMLRIADPSFRESLLKRLALRDRGLARELRTALGN